MAKYHAYHVHSMLSSGTTNIDSITNFNDYVTAAKNCGMEALGFAEHGNIFEWVHKKEAIEKAGMKYIHAIEAYLTEDLFTFDEESGKDKKVNDNYHCVLIAKNHDGVKEINKLESKSWERADADGHFYYRPRMTFDEIFNTSDNIIITTACLGGVLYSGTSSAKEKFLNFIRNNKHRCFLEVQHHNCKEQIEYNLMLLSLSKEINVPLIAGTDTHSLNSDHADGRIMLQLGKDVFFEGEDDWDLVFKTPDELVKAYKKQGCFSDEIIKEIMDNTIVMTDMVEEFELDRKPKYPKLYKNSGEVFKKKVNEGSKWREIHKKPNKQEYFDRIHYEYGVYEHNGAIDFMLLEEDYKREMRNRGIKYGYSRGSVSGSIISYLLGVTEIDSVKYKLNFERFMNTERVSLADIDTDWYSTDKAIVREYLDNKNELYCCDIVTFNTIALKGAVRDICKSFFADNYRHFPDSIREEIEFYTKKNEKLPEDVEKKVDDFISRCGKHKEIPYNYLKKSDEINKLAEKDEEAARKKYKNLFKYVDLVNGVVVSVGNHPSACVVSPFPVDEWFGTFTTKTNKYPISVINMKEIDSLNFVKLDILCLDNIGLIYKTCDIVGIPFATPDNIPGDDINVWNSIADDTTMIFQWESESATRYLKQLFSKKTIENIKKVNPNVSYMDLLSIGNGAIRPAGESYRNQLANGVYKDNGHEALNKFLEPTLGYLVYQEQIIEFLHSFCGYTMGEADIVRRGFSKKSGTEQFIPRIKQGFYQTMKEQYGVEEEESDKIIVDFLQVIKDASAYLFSKNHSDPYSWIGYICGYLRYYYPIEFVTVALNIFKDKNEKTLAIIDYAKKVNIKISPIKFRFSRSEYNFSKETNEIFKGIESIKNMNAQIADEMYDLRENEYQNFTELLFDLKEKTTLKKDQKVILIELGFFSEFGDTNYLLEQNKMFLKLGGKKQIRKEIIEDIGIHQDLIIKYSTKETEKMFVGVDTRGLLIENAANIKYTPRTLKEDIESKIDKLGYLDIADEKYAGYVAVLDIDTKYSPKVKLHSLKYGTILECKISKKTFTKNQFKKCDILKMKKWHNKFKSVKDENGNWVQLEDQIELWVDNYEKVNYL